MQRSMDNNSSTHNRNHINPPALSPLSPLDSPQEPAEPTMNSSDLAVIPVDVSWALVMLVPVLRVLLCGWN